jgi:hypothetical protein
MLRPLAVLAALLAAGPSAAVAQSIPAPDPPHFEAPPASESRERTPGGGSAPLLAEWTLHRSADGAHPDGVEQAYVWLMNRARQDPAAEGVFLATLDESGVGSALLYFAVDVALLQQEFAAIPPKPPAAFDVRLYEAALAHSLDLIARDAQDHSGQFDRVDEAGFHAQAMRGNVFSYARDPLYGHAAFNVDWGGNDGTGMQSGRGHRKAIMSIDGDYANVGLAAVPEQQPGTRVGPSVVTANFARAATSYPDHHNRFLVGTVWEDLDEDGLYDPGEGVEGVTVLPSRGSWFAVTAAGGGYALPVEEPGAVDVAFSGGGVATRTFPATVGAGSVLVDYELRSAALLPEPAHGAGLAAALALAALARRAGRPARSDRHRPA